MKKIATFEVSRHACIDEEGHEIGELPSFAANAEKLCEFYRWMVLTRTFDAKAVALQRTGRLGTFASSLGQEAVSVSVGLAMAPLDVLLPSFREQGAQFIRGVTMVELLTYWGGEESGSDFANCPEDFPICVPVASHAAHAAGVALAFKLRAEPRVAVCVLGDGATSKGDFYEALNFAGLWKLPLVFVINNNEWAISLPRRNQTTAATLAQKAIAVGVHGEQVDGNDAIAMKSRLDNAMQKARTGEGPILIEAMTYRLSDHTTADDATRYRDNEEVSGRWKLEPVRRLRQFMTAAGFWNKDDEERLLTSCKEEVEAAVESYLARPSPVPEAMFDHLFAELPKAMTSQREDLLAQAERLSRRDGEAE